jgi:hypothetical protein
MSMDEWDAPRARSEAIPIGVASGGNAVGVGGSVPRDASPLVVDHALVVDDGAACDALPALREPASTFSEHRGAVVGADWLSHGAAVASADRRGVVCLWDASVAQVIARTSLPDAAAAGGEHDDGSGVEAGGGGGELDATMIGGGCGGGRALVLHVEGGSAQPLFAVASSGGRAVMWDARSMSAPALSLSAHEGACSSTSLTRYSIYSN